MNRCVFVLAVSLAVVVIACTPSGPSDPTPGAPDAAPVTGGDPDASPVVTIPFAVDDWFAPSGYMGDGAQPGAIEDNPSCDGQRAGNERGACHLFTWHPGGEGWGGVFWQYPDGNWGETAGLDIPNGATAVSFYAWGQTGGEVVAFMAGMGEVDGFEVKREDIVLTTEPVQYSLSLSDTGYDVVVGAFGWVAADSTQPVVFHVDDIVWE